MQPARECASLAEAPRGSPPPAHLARSKAGVAADVYLGFAESEVGNTRHVWHTHTSTDRGRCTSGWSCLALQRSGRPRAHQNP